MALGNGKYSNGGKGSSKYFKRTMLLLLKKIRDNLTP